MKKIVSLILMLSILCTFTMSAFAYDVNTNPKNYDFYGDVGMEPKIENGKLVALKFTATAWTTKKDDYWSEKEVDKISSVMKIYVDGSLYKKYTLSDDDVSMISGSTEFLYKKGSYKIVVTHTAEYDPFFGKADNASVTSTINQQVIPQ